jgi:hypothetical protein
MFIFFAWVGQLDIATCHQDNTASFRGLLDSNEKDWSAYNGLITLRRCFWSYCTIEQFNDAVKMYVSQSLHMSRKRWMIQAKVSKCKIELRCF